MVSGHPVVWLHHPEKGRQASECRCGSTCCIRTRRVASVCIGGDRGHLGDGDGSGWVGTLRLLGRMEGGGFGDEVFCSVIFLFILIYYNNEIPPVVLHSYSENYIFFEYGNLFFSKDEGGVSKWKHPPFGGCVKIWLKKLKNIFICLCLVAVQAQSSRPDLIGYCRNLDWVLLGWGVQSVERFLRWNLWNYQLLLY